MSALVCTVLLAAVAAQQIAPPDEEAPPEIVVTGERVPRSVRETPSSVSVVTSADIKSQAAPDRIEQILELIPNVQMSSGGEGPTIRGQDTTGPTRDLYAFLGGTKPRTTLIVDGRAVGFNEFIFGITPIWDVDRVEVFRSPQTTTQGQNSIAGAIFIVTNSPTADPEFRARAIVGDAHTRQVSAVASGPLSPEVSVRVAGDYRYSHPSSVILDDVDGADPNRDEYGLVRFKLLATPSAFAGTRLELGYVHTQSQMPQIEGVRAPFRERRDDEDGYGTFRTNVDALTAAFRYDPSARFSLNTIFSAGDSDIQRFAPEGLGETEIGVRDWSAEAVLNWSANDAIRLLAGASHTHRRTNQYIDLSQLAGEGRFRDRQGGTGLFGEVSWSLIPRTTLTAGLRYQRDSQVRTGSIASRDGPIILDFDRTFEAWLPKLSLAYDFTDDVRAGMLVQRAYNPGGVSLRYDLGQPDPYEAETLRDYEIFARARLAGGKLNASANLFYYDMRDAQRSQPIRILTPTGLTVTFADLFNLPEARSYGLEAAMDWQASARLKLRAGLGLLDTKITRVGPANVAFAGKNFQRAPELSVSGTIDWQPLDWLRLSAQARHNGGYWSDDLNTPVRRVDGWTRVDARAECDVGKFRLFAYGRNVFDDFHMTYLFLERFGTAGDPRELGIGLETRF